MASEQMKPVALLLLVLNLIMYIIVLGIGSWAMNRAIDHGFIIGKSPSPLLHSLCFFLPSLISMHYLLYIVFC
jgi:hypothetical protein